MTNDTISSQAVIDSLCDWTDHSATIQEEWHLRQVIGDIKSMPSAGPEIIRCKDCKLNPKYEWFGYPMSHLSEKQRPETAWCWKAERRTDE